MRSRSDEPSRLRLRRRLVMFSTPVAAVVLFASIKMISVVVAGNSAIDDFAQRDVDALGADISTLELLNVIEPARAPFAAGALAVLDGRLDQADDRFSDALRRGWETDSCAVRVNLELVRETQGDLIARDGDRTGAAERYTSALAVLSDAPAGCFAGNADLDAQRRAVRDDAADRLAAKLAALDTLPPSAPPPPDTPAAPPPPPAGQAPTPDTLDSPLRLDPGGGDPIERLQRLLEDAEASN